MKRAWEIAPSGLVTEFELDDSTEENFIADLFTQARARIAEDLDFAKVRWSGEVCTMVVDDLGHAKGLPVNALATQAYWNACKPGTHHAIRGTVIVLDGLAP